MRAWPFGIAYYLLPHEGAKLAAEHSKITHGAPLALASCAGLAMGISKALVQEPTDDPLDVAHAIRDATAIYDAKTKDLINKAIDYAKKYNASLEPDFAVFEEFRGWAAHEALAAATYLFLRYPNDPMAAIARGVNTPGDSDSIASLAGALVGARTGMSTLQSQNLTILENYELLEHYTQKMSSMLHFIIRISGRDDWQDV